MKLNKIYDANMTNKGTKEKYQYEYFHMNKSVIPVYNRKKTDTITTTSEQDPIHVNYFEDIVNRKTGYMASDIKVSSENEDLLEVVKEFEKETKQDINNIDSISNAAISGVSHRLLYTSDGEVKLKNIPAWQVVYDGDIFNPFKAYYYYSTKDLLNTVTFHCDIYDDTTVQYYEAQGSDVKISDIEYLRVDEQLHNFNSVPLFPFLNNGDESGNCSDTLNLMDNYDFIFSDTGDELKSTKLSYLKIFGNLLTGTDSKGNKEPVPSFIKRVKILFFGNDEEGKKGGDAQWLEKNINDDVVEHQLDRLRTHIYEVSQSVDLKELISSTDARVFTVQAAISRMEMDAALTERFVRTALIKQYDLLFDWLQEFTGKSYLTDELTITFGRIFVKDVESLIRTLSLALNTMPAIEAYKLSGLFDNPEEVALAYEDENRIVPFGDENE